MSTAPCDVFDAFIHGQGLWFQYPAQTERAFYHGVIRQHAREAAPYMPLPYATLIDKRYDLRTTCARLLHLVRTCDPRPTFTCCQHINWRAFIPFWKQAGIRTVYTPHKTRGEDWVDGLRIEACPLFAVNIETLSLRTGLPRCPQAAPPRDLLYSFIGAHMPHYMSAVRRRIFAIRHPRDACVEHIGAWHLQNVVYGARQSAQGLVGDDDDQGLRERTVRYNTVLVRSTFSLCPSGAGPNSIRFWESLAVGAIPVILSDSMCLPPDGDGEADGWLECTVRLEEDRLDELEPLLRGFDANRLARMSALCVAMYERHALTL